MPESIGITRFVEIGGLNSILTTLLLFCTRHSNPFHIPQKITTTPKKHEVKFASIIKNAIIIP